MAAISPSQYQYDPLSKPDATTNRLSSDAGREQRLNAKMIADCDITIADNNTATPEVTFQFKDLRGRPYRGYVQVLLSGHTVEWGAVAGGDVYTAAAVDGLLVHALTAERVGYYRTDDNGKLTIEVSGSDDDYWLRVDAGGQVFQSETITVSS